MNIPESIKIGGVTYAVEITNRLNLGNVNYSGEIDYVNLVIRICPNAQQKREVDLLHELLHAFSITLDTAIMMRRRSTNWPMLSTW